MTKRAVVLGGGGVTGVAWEIGVLAGLAEAGLDLSRADLVVGSSAGSVVGVDLLSGLNMADVYARQLQPPVGEIKARISPLVLFRYLRAAAFTKDPQLARARIGAIALRARTESEAARRAVIESRVPVREWPAGLLKITAIDAQTGDFVVFDRTSGVDIVSAVGASCAVPGVWPPVTIDGRRYIDGAMRSPGNVDLASGYQTVVVLAPLVRGFGTMPSVYRQAKELTAAGSTVVVIEPDEAALRAIGRNVLDPGHRVPAARAGYEQGTRQAATVAAVWSRDAV